MTPILEIEALYRSFGALTAVDGISLRVAEGEVVGIVGTNGSGKTTLLNLITGYLRPTAGEIRFAGAPITRLGPRRIIALGIARTFQIPQLYTGLSVIENLLVTIATRAGRGSNFWSELARPAWVEEGRSLLAQIGLDGQRDVPASALPEGGRKLLDVAMSVVLRPTLLLMDEPTSGVSAEDKFEVMNTLMAVLAESGVTTVFVEHDMEIVERHARRAIAFDAGTIISDGEVAEVLSDPEVRRAVLGEE